ncbi:MAG: EcsC family protein [Erysipelotrichaceae bacterium]|nr:EcsC family protein [Erysipelotrichaceae bacterium]
MTENITAAENKKSGFDLMSVLKTVMKMPIARIDRTEFLQKELLKIYPESVVKTAIEYNPAYAGISRKKIESLASRAINEETAKASSLSFLAGLPGGLVMAATIPADVAQYFVFILRIMQKLAYLYGFPDFGLTSDDVNNETMDEVVVFLGAMLGVETSNAGVKILAHAASERVTRVVAEKAVAKASLYPIVERVAASIGVKLTKSVFAKGVGKAVPVLGGVINGGLTFFTFKPNCKKLQKSFTHLDLSDPEYYKEQRMNAYRRDLHDKAEAGAAEKGYKGIRLDLE